MMMMMMMMMMAIVVAETMMKIMVAGTVIRRGTSTTSIFSGGIGQVGNGAESTDYASSVLLFTPVNGFYMNNLS